MMMPKVDLILGDCLEVMKGMPDKSVDAVITDPPYKLTSGGNNVQSGLRMHFENKWGYDNQGKFFAVPEFEDWMSLAYRCGKDDSEFFAMSNDKNVRDMLNAADEAGFRFHNFIIWDKQIKIANKWFMKQCEYILYFWKGKARNLNNMGAANLFSYRPDNIGSKSHPSEKPVELMKMIIESCSHKGDTILDPFMGSGTTGVACVQTDRNFIGIEIDPDYFVIAERRIKEAQMQPRLL